MRAPKLLTVRNDQTDASSNPIFTKIAPLLHIIRNNIGANFSKLLIITNIQIMIVLVQFFDCSQEISTTLLGNKQTGMRSLIDQKGFFNSYLATYECRF